MNTAREKRTVKIPILSKRPVFKLKKSEWDNLRVILVQTLTFRLFVVDCFVKKARELAQNGQYDSSFSAFLNSLSIFKKSDLIGTSVHFQKLASKAKRESSLSGKSNSKSEITSKEKKGNFRKDNTICYTYIDNTTQNLQPGIEPVHVRAGHAQGQGPPDAGDSEQPGSSWESYCGFEIKRKISAILLELAEVLWKMGDLGKLRDVCREGLQYAPQQLKFYIFSAKLHKSLSSKKQTKKNLKLTLANLHKGEEILRQALQPKRAQRIRLEISQIRRRFLKRVLRDKLGKKLGLAWEQRVQKKHVVGYLRRLFARVFHLIKKLHFSFSISNREQCHMRQICRSFRVIRRQFKDFLLFFERFGYPERAPKGWHSPAGKSCLEDHRQIDLVLMFFITVQKRRQSSKKSTRRSRSRFGPRRDSTLRLCCKWRKLFESAAPGKIESDFVSHAEKGRRPNQGKSRGAFPELLFEMDEVVQPAHRAAELDCKSKARERGKQGDFNLSKELAKSADEIKQGIQQDFRKQNKVYFHQLKKLFKENCKTSSKNRQKRKQQKLEKNLSLLRERQELKILENVWETHSRYQRNCSNFNMSEILKVTETNSQKEQREDYILRAMNAFIMVFVCFFIFVSISVIYLIRINQF